MELLDPNSEEGKRLPAEVRKMIGGNWKSGMSDTFRKIALIELGLFEKITEEDLRTDHNLTEQQWAAIKKSHRNEIEKYKESHKLSKLRVINSVSDRISYGEIYAKAILSGDLELARKAKLILETLSKHLPMDDVHRAGEILTDMDDAPKELENGRANIQINVNSPASEAQKRLEEKKKKKEIDV